MPWLIAQTIRLPHRNERLRQANGARSMEQWIEKLQARGIPAYYPMVRETRPVPRKELSRSQRAAGVILMRPRVAPFLPGMVFVGADREIEVRDHPCVLGFIGMGEASAIIADELVDELRRREQAGGGAIPGATPWQLIFRKGETVQIVHGPLTGQKGVIAETPAVPIEQIDPDTRLKLILGEGLFGVAHVSIAVADISKI